MAETYQQITLVMADGRRLTYVGRGQIDHLFPVRVTDIIVTPARPLPEGMMWDKLIPKESSP